MKYDEKIYNKKLLYLYDKNYRDINCVKSILSTDKINVRSTNKKSLIQVTYKPNIIMILSNSEYDAEDIGFRHRALPIKMFKYH